MGDRVNTGLYTYVDRCLGLFRLLLRQRLGERGNELILLVRDVDGENVRGREYLALNLEWGLCASRYCCGVMCGDYWTVKAGVNDGTQL